MKKLFAIIAVLTASCIMFCACGNSQSPKSEAKVTTQTEQQLLNMGDWFADSFCPAFTSYIEKTNSEVVPAFSIDTLVISPDYLTYCTSYIDHGIQPPEGEITESNGVYAYTKEGFTQKYEFDEASCSLKITTERNGTQISQLIITERDGKFYMQFVENDFGNYSETVFDSEDGVCAVKDFSGELPYTIFGNEIPENFAAE